MITQDISIQPIDYVNGISSLIYVSVSLLVGIIIMSKYLEYKQRAFLFVGLTWIGITEPWIPSSLSFLVALFTGTRGLNLSTYVLIGNIFVPLVLLCWLAAFTDLMYEGKKKSVLIIYAIIGVIFEAVFFLQFFSQPELIGVFHYESTQLNIDIDYQFFVLGYLLFVIATMLITGVLFSRKSLKSNDPVIKLKGKLLFFAFLCWTIGAILDSSIPLNIVTLPVTRLILVLSSLLFYAGFMLPQWVKQLFIKE